MTFDEVGHHHDVLCHRKAVYRVRRDLLVAHRPADECVVPFRRGRQRDLSPAHVCPGACHHACSLGGDRHRHDIQSGKGKLIGLFHAQYAVRIERDFAVA